VASVEAQHYHRLHDQLLIGRKNGYYLSDLCSNGDPSADQCSISALSISDLNSLSSEHLSPHYLVKPSLSQQSQMSSLISQSYHSTSILGKLYDFILELVDQFNLCSPAVKVSTTSDVKEESGTDLDPHLRADFEICCCFNERFDDLLEKQNHLIRRSFTDPLFLVDSSSVKSSYLTTAKHFFSRYF
jgi:hypothetical protein